MPIYDFECEECGERFEAFVEVGTASATCTTCGSERTRRRFTAPAVAPKFVKSRGATRQQEARNAKLHSDAKSRFKESRRKARERATRRQGGGDG